MTHSHELASVVKSERLHQGSENADSGRSTRGVYNSASAVKTSARMLTEVNECFGEKSFRVHEMLMKEEDGC